MRARVGIGDHARYVAKERGYFAQEGLDLDVLVAPGQICTMAFFNGHMERSSNPNIFDPMVAGKPTEPKRRQAKAGPREQPQRTHRTQNL